MQAHSTLASQSTEALISHAAKKAKKAAGRKAARTTKTPVLPGKKNAKESIMPTLQIEPVIPHPVYSKYQADMEFSPTGCSNRLSKEWKAEHHRQVCDSDSVSGRDRTWVTTNKTPQVHRINGAWKDRECLDLTFYRDCLLRKLEEMENEDDCDLYLIDLIWDAIVKISDGKTAMIPNLIPAATAAKILGFPSETILFMEESLQGLFCDKYVMGNEVYYLNRDVYSVAAHLKHTGKEDHYCPLCKKALGRKKAK